LWRYHYSSDHEKTAKAIIQYAKILEANGEYKDSLKYYRDGIQMWINVLTEAEEKEFEQAVKDLASLPNSFDPELKNLGIFEEVITTLEKVVNIKPVIVNNELESLLQTWASLSSDMRVQKVFDRISRLVSLSQ
jgi:tetratricopeptide (TPR) repeat protein